MKTHSPPLIVTCLLGMAGMTSQIQGAEIATRVVDGLGHPLPGATVEVKLDQEAKSGEVTNVNWLKLIADQEGRVKGSYDEKRNSFGGFQVGLAGYSGYSGYPTGLRAEYVLQRKVGAKDLRRAARLKGEPQERALKDVLVGDYEVHGSDEIFSDLILTHYQQLRPGLRALVRDPIVGTHAAKALSLIGVPEDLQLIIEHAPAPKRESFGNRWAYQVVCALFEPQTEQEWDFLTKCAANGYDDLWVDRGAIETLRLIASPRSLDALRQVQDKNGGRRRKIEEAINYVESNPPPLSSTNVIEAAKAVAQALQVGNWEGNKEPRLNDEGDMALVNCRFVAGRDEYIYTATFHRIGGVWKLRGVRETSQGLMAYPPDRKLFVGAWHGFSIGNWEFARLELKEDGTGLLAISYGVDSPAYAYRVTKWLVRGHEVLITTERTTPYAEEVTLQHVIYGTRGLNLELHGRGWSKKMRLFNESDFERRVGAAKKSIQGMSKP